MSDNNKEEPFLLSDYQMYEIKKLTKQLEEMSERIKAKNNFCNRILYAFKNPYPIKETNKKVYHVSGFKPIQMFKILFSGGLRWVKHKGIYYNSTEFGYCHVSLLAHAKGIKPKRRHVSIIHAKSFHITRLLGKKHWIGPIWFRFPSFGYLRRFGVLPLNVTYEIDTKGFGDSEVYVDATYENPPTDDNGDEYTIFRYVKQDCIPPQYIRLKAITFALPIFGIYKVLWRRKDKK